ncbi:MAG: hypothetical protein JO362_20255 [Streptomycetaceae bacterium]|nr:hypothetical protein [Streptomycetaceae bacterium]
MDAIVRTAEQIVVIEAARAYVAGTEGRVVDTANPGQLVGHLMSAEVLLMRIAEAFAEPATTA